jgi:hypothetical protein
METPAIALNCGLPIPTFATEEELSRERSAVCDGDGCTEARMSRTPTMVRATFLLFTPSSFLRAVNPCLFTLQILEKNSGKTP